MKTATDRWKTEKVRWKKKGKPIQKSVGDKPGHPFRGNQYTEGESNEDPFDNKDRDFSAMLNFYQSWTDNIEDITDWPPRIEAIQHYTDHGHEVINGYLRGTYSKEQVASMEEFEELEPGYNQRAIQEFENMFDSVFARAPENLAAWRGVGLEEGDPLYNYFENAEPGDWFDDRGFASLSLNRTVAENFAQEGDMRLLVKVEIEKGQRALPISKYGTMMEEMELLLPAGRRFIIQDNYFNEDSGYREVTVRIK